MSNHKGQQGQKGRGETMGGGFWGGAEDMARLSALVPSVIAQIRSDFNISFIQRASQTPTKQLSTKPFVCFFSQKASRGNIHTARIYIYTHTRM